MSMLTCQACKAERPKRRMVLHGPTVEPYCAPDLPCEDMYRPKEDLIKANDTRSLYSYHPYFEQLMKNVFSLRPSLPQLAYLVRYARKYELNTKNKTLGHILDLFMSEHPIHDDVPETSPFEGKRPMGAKAREPVYEQNMFVQPKDPYVAVRQQPKEEEPEQNEEEEEGGNEWEL